MHVVHVSIGALPAVFTSAGGAIQRRVSELARVQVERGHQVTVFSPGTEDAVHEIDGVTVHYLRCRLPAPARYLEYQARVAARLDQARLAPAILQYHSEPEASFTSRRIPCPTLLSYDNFYFRGGRRTPWAPLYRSALNSFDALLPCSEYCAEQSTRYWHLARARVHVIPNGVNLSRIKPDPAGAMRERSALPGGSRILLFLGRICEQKGADLLLEAYAQVRRHHPNTELLMVGPIASFTRGEDDTRWVRDIEAVGGHYLGQVEDERLPGLLTAADIFVLPTRRLEMFGMAAMEAQACGTPVVSSDHGGLVEVVPDAVGLRFPSGDSAALAECLLKLLQEDDLRRRLAAGAAQHAAQFSWQHVAEKLDEVYVSVGSGPAARVAG